MGEFLLARGINVPDLTGIHECYEIGRRNEFSIFTVNISVHHIESLIRGFCAELAEPCFFMLEVPTQEADERRLRLEKTDPFHCDVYYCDGLSKQTLLGLIEKHGELLIHDGASCFGLASHASRDELYFGRYKIAKIFTADEQYYKDLLCKMDIPLEENIRTVWDNFSHEAPGTTSAISIDGKNIYDALEDLKKCGFYFAERREQ